MENNYFTASEVVASNVNGAYQKIHQPLYKIIMFGILAGMFIAIGGQASNVACHAVENPGLAKTVAGVVFPIGLMLIVIIGGHLFTGNCLLTMGVMDGKITLRKMLTNWCIIYFSNMIGSIIIALLVYYSGQFNMNDQALGAYYVKLAVGKLNLTPLQAITSGILCNIIVCGAILMAGTAKDISGKCLTIFFAIFAFVVSGFEHCVANMYYFAAGVLSAGNADYVEKAKELYHITEGKVDSLTIGSIFMKNLIPVGIGNAIGGGILIGGSFYLLYRKNKNK